MISCIPPSPETETPETLPLQTLLEAESFSSSALADLQETVSEGGGLVGAFFFHSGFLGRASHGAGDQRRGPSLPPRPAVGRCLSVASAPLQRDGTVGNVSSFFSA